MNDPKEMKITIAQAIALHDRLRVANEGRTHEKQTFKEFLETVSPTFGCDDAVVVPWCGMILCIETDGYCHS